MNAVKNMLRKTKLIMTMVSALVLILAFSAASFAETDVNPKNVFLKMPAAKDLNKEYDGKQPAWIDFDYEIDAEATLWVNDKSKGEDGLGLVWLDIYRWNETTGTYVEYDMGRYPGNMEGPGFNMDKAGSSITVRVTARAITAKRPFSPANIKLSGSFLFTARTQKIITYMIMWNMKSSSRSPCPASLPQCPN